jgi:hypothetical protein
MEWLKDNYEKASLNVAGIALLVSCALIIARAISFSEQFIGRNSPKPPDNAIMPLPADALVAASKKLKSPQNWTGHDVPFSSPALMSLWMVRSLILLRAVRTSTSQ